MTKLGALMPTTPLSDPSFMSFVSKEAELEKPSAYIGKTSIWIDGQSPTGSPRTVTLELYRCTKESIKLSAALIDQEQATYSSLLWEHHTAMTLGQMALLSRLLIDQLLSGQGSPILRYTTGDPIGQAKWP